MVIKVSSDSSCRRWHLLMTRKVKYPRPAPSSEMRPVPASTRPQSAVPAARPIDGFGPPTYDRTDMARVFGITPNILALSGQSPSGPAGGARDGYGLGRGAAGPGGGTSRTARGCSESLPQDVTIHMSAHAPPPEPNRDRTNRRI